MGKLRQVIHQVQTSGGTQQSVLWYLPNFAPAKLVAIQVAGGASEPGKTLSLRVVYELDGVEHLLGASGDVTLEGTSWKTEFLPGATPVRQSDTIHIVPIACPGVLSRGNLKVVSSASPTEVWISDSALLIEPLA